MAYPNNYESAGDFFSDIGEVKIFTLFLSTSDSATVLDVNDLQGFTPNTPVSFYGVFDDAAPGQQPEIVKITHISNPSSYNQITVQRGVDGTTGVFHAGGAKIIVEPNFTIFDRLRDALDLIQTNPAALLNPASITAQGGELMYYNGDLYVGLTNGTTKRMTYINHNDLDGLGDDDHLQYYNNTRAEQWHDALSPLDHITAVAHEHNGTDAPPVKKFVAGLSSARPASPTAAGQLYYETDTKYLYFATAPGTWEQYSTMVSGATMFFHGNCPQGWTRQGQLDGYFLRGAATAGGVGGALSHNHGMPTVIAHSHAVPQITGNTQDAGSHDHSVIWGGGSQTDINATTTGSGYQSSNSAGSHNHTFTPPAQTTYEAGVDNPVTDNYDNYPPFYTLVICKKD